MDLSLIQGAVTGLKTASDITQGLLKLHTVTEVQGKVIELQSAILGAQSSALAANAEQIALHEQIRELMDRLSRAEAWECQRQRYELRCIAAGSFAHALKESEAQGEPPHWVCSRCFSDGKAIPLQNTGDTLGVCEYECHGCMSKIRVPADVLPAF